MNAKFHLPLLALFIASACALYAGEKEKRSFGDAAFYAGDYRNAAEYYEQARQISDAEKLPEAWSVNTLRLGSAQVGCGDIAAAKKTLAEFRARNPIRSAGTLPGDLLAAEGKFAEAENFFRILEQQSEGEARFEVIFSRASLLLRQEKLPEARALFETLEREAAAVSSRWAETAKQERFYVRLRQGEHREVLAELNHIPAVGRTKFSWKFLKAMADVQNGDLNAYLAAEKELLKDQLPYSPRIFALLLSAASLAEQKQNFTAARQILELADDCSVDESARRYLFRRRIDLFSRFDALAAAQLADRYAEEFPTAPDCGHVLISAAQLLVQKKMVAEAFRRYEKVTGSERFALADRIEAASGGAAVAERTGQLQQAAVFYRFLTSVPSDKKERLRWLERFAEMLCRFRDYRGAMEQLEKALTFSEEKEREKYAVRLLDVAGYADDLAALGKWAKWILDSPASRGSGAAYRAEYEVGRAASAVGKYDEARRHYLAAASGKTAVAVHSRFAAAQMLLQSGKVAEAYPEFVGFAKANPRSDEAPEALFLALDAGRRLESREKMDECRKLLEKNYPKSLEFAITALQNASALAERGDLDGALSQAAQVEKDFAFRREIRLEAMLLRAKVLNLRGDRKAALALTEEIGKLSDPGSFAAENAMLAGNILYSGGSYAEARKMYLNVMAWCPEGILHEVSAMRIIDCDLAVAGNDAQRLDEMNKRCETLIARAQNPAIRLQARYKSGRCLELSGAAEAAVSAYEKLFYEAGVMRTQGIAPEAKWCIHALESALHLLENGVKRGIWTKRAARLRGIRLIRQFETLDVPGAETVFPHLRDEWQDKFKTQRNGR